jgi:hypothetical protein
VESINSIYSTRLYKRTLSGVRSRCQCSVGVALYVRRTLSGVRTYGTTLGQYPHMVKRVVYSGLGSCSLDREGREESENG